MRRGRGKAQVTQDSTPPGPIFQGSIPPHHQERRSGTGSRWKDFVNSVPTACRLELESYLVREQPSFENRSSKGV